ncbi:hypothetical protein RB213_008669 [Colletotrichum asianum]
MCAYSQLFELVLNKIERQFVLGGKQGLNLARSEAVAVVNQLGGLSTPGSGGAVINIGWWPHSARTGRPMLLHV